MDKQISTEEHVRNLFLVLLFTVGTCLQASAQVNSGCVSGSFGIDAGLYSGVIEYGTGIEPVSPALRSNDWFQGIAGIGVINETDTVALRNLLQAPGNPTYIAEQKYAIASIIGAKILIDALFARDQFGGTGETDLTSYTQASKNGDDPANWYPGPANVLGKNDIIDVAGFMFRNGQTLNDDLWFVGLFNMAEPGGTSYMDFEFYVQPIFYNQSQQKFSSGGPQLGHTAYNFTQDLNDPLIHQISKVGDFIFSVSLLSSGPVVETRLWVSRTDWQTKIPAKFDWAGTFDGAYNGSPYGYAGIKPKSGAPPEFCGIVNVDNQLPLAPPWGTKNTKTNVWGTTYQPYSIAEVAINLTNYGMDHASLLGVEDCFFPLNSFIVKTRASASFTAQLKDFAGPFNWASPSFFATVVGEDLSCANLTAFVIAYPNHPDVIYEWSTIDGNIAETFPAEPWKIRVNKPGTYQAKITFETECFSEQIASATVRYDNSIPYFNNPILLNTAHSCNGVNGSITLNVTGAIGTYTYTWTKDGSPYLTQSNITPGNHTLSNLQPGTYAVTIKGIYACTTFIGDMVIKAGSPPAFTPTRTDVTCFGLRNGKIELGTITGNPPFTFLWSTGNTNKDLLNIGAGTYTVNVTDADGCTTVGNYTITQPTALSGTIVKTNDTDPDPVIGTGTATLTPTGGTGTYTYFWVASETGTIPTGQATNQNLTELDYGRYTVTITDANVCTATATVFIFEPEICNDGIDNDGDGLNNCNDSDCIPATPGTITPTNTTPCVGIAVTYTVPVNPSYGSYEWSVPGNATINSGQGTNSISVTWNTTAGGQICVRGKIFDCLSVASCINVSVADVPPTSGAIIINNN
ncbi:MAG: hypothetical protein Q8M23_04930 [Bacteroidales bacterium]|nr:hypothetical protein [Bacteroidales bacterium]